jgi:curli biogenesis system outer membrane secretion channel CsgG
MSNSKANRAVKTGLASLLALGCGTLALADGVTGYQAGQGASPIQGAAGTNSSIGADGLEHCVKPMGAIAVVEPQDNSLQYLSRYSLQSPTALIRMIIQQSNCFIVVERGQAMQNMKQERALAGSGELRSGSNIGGGQMVGADFILTPSVVFSESNAGGVGGGLGGLIPGSGGALFGAVAGGLKFKEAQTTMLVSDSRSGVQVVAAEGSTKKADIKLGGALFGGGAGGGVGGYGNTNEGKIIAAAFLDNYKKVVAVVNGDPSLQRDVGTLRQEAGKVLTAGAVFNEGDIVVPKIANVRLLSSAEDGAAPTATLAAGEQLVVLGPEQNGYLNVQGGAASGWVKKVLVTRQN